MTLRAFIGAAYTYLVEELRSQGMGLQAAIEAVHDVFKPLPTPQEQAAAAAAAEAERNKQNERVMASMMMGAMPTPKRKEATA